MFSIRYSGLHGAFKNPDATSEAHCCLVEMWSICGEKQKNTFTKHIGFTFIHYQTILNLTFTNQQNFDHTKLKAFAEDNFLK